MQTTPFRTVVNLTTPFPLQALATQLVIARRNSPTAAAAIKLAGDHLLGSYAGQLGKLAGLEKPPLPIVLGVLALCVLAQIDVLVIVDREEIKLTGEATPLDVADVGESIERARRTVITRLFRTAR